MCTADATHAGDAFNPAGRSFSDAPAAVAAAAAAMDYLNTAVADLDGSSCGELLIALGQVQAKLTAAHAGLLRRFDAADAHDADGYGSSSSWLAAKAGMSKKGARTAVRQMRQLAARPRLGSALAAGAITDSLASTVADWTRKLPGGMRDETDRILLQAAAAGASLDDLAAIAACAIETWRAQQPDPDEPDPADRYLQLGTTFGDAGVIRGDLTPECNAAVRAVLEALGKKAGPEDDRTEGQRFHDALQLACAPLWASGWSSWMQACRDGRRLSFKVWTRLTVTGLRRLVTSGPMRSRKGWTCCGARRLVPSTCLRTWTGRGRGLRPRGAGPGR